MVTPHKQLSGHAGYVKLWHGGVYLAEEASVTFYVEDV
jgi:hypothetical protein